MKLKEKYKLKGEVGEKIELSNDAFAICDFIQDLINKLEHARVSGLR